MFDLDIDEVEYSQNSIKPEFTDGTLLIDLIHDMAYGGVTPEHLPPIAVKHVRGRWYALKGNRRLYCYKTVVRYLTSRLRIPVVEYTGRPKAMTVNHGVPLKIRGGQAGQALERDVVALLATGANSQRHGVHETTAPGWRLSNMAAVADKLRGMAI